MSAASLLVEIRTEELPPAQLWRLADAFPDLLLEELRKKGFADDKSQRAKNDNENKLLATPRRLVALLQNIKSESAAKTVMRRGPQIAACKDSEGAPTKALIGFMQSIGATCENDLQQIEENGKTYVAWKNEEPPRRLANELAAVVESVLLNLPAPRLMRWGDNDFKFIRPVRGILMIHGNETIGGEVFGIRAGKTTKGHPVLCAKEIAPQNANEYESVMRESGKVIADMDVRLEEIRTKLADAMKENSEINFPRYETEVQDNRAPRFSPISAENPLLREVAAMCEFPAVYHQKINDAFMQLPKFCVEECMKTHLRFFSCNDSTGNLLPDYFLVADNAPKNPEAMLRGYENVLRARLDDVRYYYETDKKIPLAEYVEKLKTIVFHKKLGNQHARIERVCRIAAAIAESSGAAHSPEEIKYAAEQYLAPLSTLMVNEYPQLQEYMAREYFGNSSAANFIFRCYELEKLAGMFGIGETPTGSKDPHGLRRDALRIVIQFWRWNDIKKNIAAAVESFDGQIADVRNEVYEFILERIRFVFSQNAPFRITFPVPSPNVMESVLSLKPSDLRNLNFVLEAVDNFTKREESAILIAANKRINNIFRKSGVEVESLAGVNESLFGESAERALYKTVRELRQKTDALIAKNDYGGALTLLCDAAAPTDKFFDEVLVNAEDEKIRANRFALLGELRALLNRVADISRLA